MDHPDSFQKLTFGDDVAERDNELHQYFVSTYEFKQADEGSASVIIGPKGSGKTAILRSLEKNRGSHNTIIITPEIFATSMLRQVIEDSKGLWDEDQAFVSTWIFTILVEVFKRVVADSRGVPASALKEVKAFLRDNANYQDVDIFSRFIGYLKRIEGIKVGEYELAIKTKMLQEMYSLAPVYALVTKLRGIGGEILILLDELDQGWDNSQHANRFIGSLLQAAIRIQGLGLKAKVIVFIRSEIFDLVKGKLDQLDKLRSGIVTLAWSDGQLADLVTKRISHSLSFYENVKDREMDITVSLFEGTIGGMNGFQYLLSRTSLRPREVLQFLKLSHRISVNRDERKITEETLLRAEEEFSNWKLDHLCAEYTHIYPGLSDLLRSFRGQGPIIGYLDALLILERYRKGMRGSLPTWVDVDDDQLLQRLYSIEFLGVPRLHPNRMRSGVVADYEFAFDRRAINVRLADTFLIQPALWSVLEVPAA